MDREIDFDHNRHMRCGRCAREFVVDLEWLDRWERGNEHCPGCGVDCQEEDAPRVIADPTDPVLDDAYARRVFWYHTSTHPDWPAKDFDPAAALTPETRLRMGGDARVAAWAKRQRTIALHVGTYEAAIQNMLRRKGDQGDRDSQFYLYRVRLRPSLTMRPGWIVDSSDGFGDVTFARVCPDGEDAARYANEHEDPGALSVALHRGAIKEVQRIEIPLGTVLNREQERRVLETLTSASDVPVPAEGKIARLLPAVSPRVGTARQLAKQIAETLPINLRNQFASAAAFVEGSDPAPWAHRAIALAELVTEPKRGLAALDDAAWQVV
ncbi:MAG: hypothetical protein V4737_13320 [Curtobacterium sp.]